jgi:hypothetical protein
MKQLQPQIFLDPLDMHKSLFYEKFTVLIPENYQKNFMALGPLVHNEKTKIQNFKIH